MPDMQGTGDDGERQDDEGSRQHVTHFGPPGVRCTSRYCPPGAYVSVMTPLW
jgi:hypothetical protein